MDWRKAALDDEVLKPFLGFIADDSRVPLPLIRMSNPFINLRKFVPLLSLTLVLVCFGFSLNAPGSTFAPTEEERVAATEQGFNGELKLAVLPRKIDPDGRTYVEVDDMLFWVSEGAGVESAFTGNRWTNGIVYYVFDAAVSSTNRQLASCGCRLECCCTIDLH